MQIKIRKLAKNSLHFDVLYHRDLCGNRTKIYHVRCTDTAMKISVINFVVFLCKILELKTLDFSSTILRRYCNYLQKNATRYRESKNGIRLQGVLTNSDIGKCTLVHHRRKIEPEFRPTNGRPSRWALPRIVAITKPVTRIGLSDYRANGRTDYG